MGGGSVKATGFWKRRAGRGIRSRCRDTLGRIVPSIRFVAGVDVGAHSARFVIVERAGTRRILRDAWRGERGARTEKEMCDEVIDRLIESLMCVAGRWTWREISCVLAVSGRGEIVRKLVMPSMPRKELRKALVLAFEKEFALEEGEVTIGSSPLSERSAKDDGPLERTAVLFRSLSLDEIMRPFQEAGFLEVNPVASQMLFARELPPGTAGVLVDIGLEKTRVFASSPDKSFLYREIGMGGANLTQALTGRFSYAKGVIELNVEGAENLKRKIGVRSASIGDEGLPDATYAHVPAILRMELGKLADELRRTLDYAKSDLGMVPAFVCLSGGGASLPGIVPYLEKSLGERVKLLDLDDLGVDWESEGPPPVPPHEIGLAVSASMWSDPEGILLTPASRLSRRLELERRLFKSAAILVACFIAAYSSLSVGLARESKVDAVLTNYSTLMATDLGRRAKDLDEERRMLTRLRSVFAFTPRLRLDTTSLLRELSHLVPEPIVLTKIEILPHGSHSERSSSFPGDEAQGWRESHADSTSLLFVEGSVESEPLLLESELSRLTQVLQRSGFFEDVRVISWGREKAEGKERLSFSISMGIIEREKGGGT